MQHVRLISTQSPRRSVQRPTENQVDEMNTQKVSNSKKKKKKSPHPKKVSVHTPKKKNVKRVFGNIRERWLQSRAKRWENILLSSAPLCCEREEMRRVIIPLLFSLFVDFSKQNNKKSFFSVWVFCVCVCVLRQSFLAGPLLLLSAGDSTYKRINMSYFSHTWNAILYTPCKRSKKRTLSLIMMRIEILKYWNNNKKMHVKSQNEKTSRGGRDQKRALSMQYSCVNAV